MIVEEQGAAPLEPEVVPLSAAPRTKIEEKDADSDGNPNNEQQQSQDPSVNTS